MRGSEARQLDLDEDGYAPELINSLKSGENDAKTTTGIKDLTGNIHEKIKRARQEGTLSQKDEENFITEISKNKTDHHAITKIGGNVDQVINESKQLISTVSLLKDTPGIDVEERLKVLKESSIDEKRELITEWKKEVKSLQNLIEKAEKLYPEAVSKLKGAQGKELTAAIKNLEERVESTLEYGTLLDDPETKKHFSADSIKDFEKSFKEISNREQKDWIKVFKEQQLKPRQRLTEKYEQLNQKNKDSIPNFKELGRTDKEEALKRVEENIDYEEMVLKGDHSAFVSKDGKQAYINYFKDAPKFIRKQRIRDTKEWMKGEAELFKAFEKLDPAIKKMHPNFIELKFDEKEKIVKKENAEGSTEKEFTQKLLNALKEGVIREEGFHSLKKAFNEQPESTRKEWVADFDKNIKDRVDLKNNFEKLPQEVQDKHQDFYNLSFADRLTRYAIILQELSGAPANDIKVLKEKPEGMSTKEQIEGLLEKAAKLEADYKQEDALKIYKAVLIFDPNHAVALSKVNGTADSVETESNLDPNMINQVISRVKSGDTMKKKLTMQTIEEGLQKLNQASTNINGQKDKAVQRDANLDNAKERELNAQLVAETGGEMIIGNDGTAEDVHFIDLKRSNLLQEADRNELKRTVTQNRGEKMNKVHNIQFQDRETGQNMSAQKAKETVKTKQELLEESIAEQTATMLERDHGTLNDADRALIKKLVHAKGTNVELAPAS